MDFHVETECTVNWRLILRRDNESDARALLSEIQSQVGHQFEIDVCEHFDESPGSFDCVFRTQVSVANRESLIRELTGIMDRLKGDWALEDPQVFESGTVDIHAFMDASDETDADVAWGHFWVRMNPPCASAI